MNRLEHATTPNVASEEAVLNTISCDGFMLRAWQPADRESLVRHANDPAVAAMLRNRFPHPYTLADADAWIEFANSQPVVNDLAIVKDDEAIGGIGLIPGEDIARHSAELGYWLGREFWGQGLMPTAVRAVTRWAFETRGFRRVFASSFRSNVASCRVLEKCGFTLEGIQRNAAVKHGRMYDQAMYALVDLNALT